jgi:hypothetical protein
MKDFMELEAGWGMIDYIAQTAYLHPYISLQNEGVAIPSLSTLITYLTRRFRVRVSALLICLVYLNRARLRLSFSTADTLFTAHSFFLAALVVAEKNTNDRTFENKDWARYTSMPNGFGFFVIETTCTEIKFLRLHDWNLRIGLEDFYRQFVPLFRDDIA